MTLILKHTTKSVPSLPFERIASAILGSSYTVTLVFIGATRARALNKKYRKASYVPNVLSFPLDAQSGEIYITPSLAVTECKKFTLSPLGYIGFLYIHGLLHLKGLNHGTKMDVAEQRFMKRFALQ